MASYYRTRGFVERSTPRFAGPHAYRHPPIKVAEIPRPLWQQPLIDWDDDDPPPLPPRFDPEVAPLTPGRRPLFVAIAATTFAAVVIGMAVLYLYGPPWAINGNTGAAATFAGRVMAPSLSSRIDTALGDLPREDLNASDEKALIRSIRPELMPPGVAGSPKQQVRTQD
jgi:hypothetical protein